MKLLTEAQRRKLRDNGLINQGNIACGCDTVDFPPVVKLFTPHGAATWLLSEIDAEDTDIAFGLCDVGMGCPELGNVRLSELAAVRGRFGLPIERDLPFTATEPLTVYADKARTAGCIVA